MEMIFLKKKKFIFLSIAIFIFAASGFFVLFTNGKHAIDKVTTKDFVYTASQVTEAADSLHPTTLQNESAVLKNPPAVLKSIYMTGWSAGSLKYLTYLYELFNTTQINSVVIDIKDATGIVSYNTGAPKARQYKTYHNEIANIDSLVNDLHSRGIYVIGRIAVFEDPALAKNRPDLAIYDTSKTTDTTGPVAWQDNNGLAWVDPASEEVWDYNIEIAKDALEHGFDEINFDYIRFPTDGNTGKMGFPAWDGNVPRHVVIKSFFKKLRESLAGAKISADIFGQITTNTDDMGIGQVFEDALEYFDYVCPMVYPSHYANGFLGYKNPAEYPYQIVTYALEGALGRLKVYDKTHAIPSTDPALSIHGAKIRPWLQDFNLGASYSADMVGQEIKAVVDVLGPDFNGYMLWNPSNIYTHQAVVREAIVP